MESVEHIYTYSYVIRDIFKMTTREDEIIGFLKYGDTN